MHFPGRFKHGDRSRESLDNSSVQRANLRPQSEGVYESRPPPSQSQGYIENRPSAQQQSYSVQAAQEDAEEDHLPSDQSSIETRSLTQSRRPAHAYPNQSAISYTPQPPPGPPGLPTEPYQASESRDIFTSSTSSVHQIVPEQKTSVSRRILRAITTKTSREPERPASPQQSSYNNTTGLSRKPSKKDPRGPPRSLQTGGSRQQQQRLPDLPSGRISQSYLPSPQEEIEDTTHFDPYQIHDRDRDKAQARSTDQSLQAEVGSHRTSQLITEGAKLQVEEEYHQQGNHDSHMPASQLRDTQYRAYNQSVNQGSQDPLGVPPSLSHPTHSQASAAQSVGQLSQVSIDSLENTEHGQPDRTTQEPIPSPVEGYGRISRTLSQHGPTSQGQQSSMAPPSASSGGQQRRTLDPKFATQNEGREAPPGFKQKFQNNNAGLTTLQPLPANPQGSPYRGPNNLRDIESGRLTPAVPPPDRHGDEEYKQLR